MRDRGSTSSQSEQKTLSVEARGLSAIRFINTGLQAGEMHSLEGSRFNGFLHLPTSLRVAD
jgi:hypothetical protein